MSSHPKLWLVASGRSRHFATTHSFRNWMESLVGQPTVAGVVVALEAGDPDWIRDLVLVMQVNDDDIDTGDEALDRIMHSLRHLEWIAVAEGAAAPAAAETASATAFFGFLKSVSSALEGHARTERGDVVCFLNDGWVVDSRAFVPVVMDGVVHLRNSIALLSDDPSVYRGTHILSPMGFELNSQVTLGRESFWRSTHAIHTPECFAMTLETFRTVMPLLRPYLEDIEGITVQEALLYGSAALGVVHGKTIACPIPSVATPFFGASDQELAPIPGASLRETWARISGSTSSPTSSVAGVLGPETQIPTAAAPEPVDAQTRRQILEEGSWTLSSPDFEKILGQGSEWPSVLGPVGDDCTPSVRSP